MQFSSQLQNKVVASNQTITVFAREVANALRDRFLPELTVKFYDELPNMPGQPRAPGGSYSLAKNEAQVNLSGFLKNKVLPKENIALSIIKTAAHEAGHGLVDKKIKSALTPVEFNTFIDRVLDTDVNFRRRIIESYASTFRGHQITEEMSKYYAGDADLLKELHQLKTVPKEYVAGEFLAELSALTMLKEINTLEIPEALKSVHQEVVAVAQQGIQQFKAELQSTAQLQPLEAQKVNDIIEVLKWAGDPTGKTSKPAWLKDAAALQPLETKGKKIPRGSVESKAKIKQASALKDIIDVHYLPHLNKRALIVEGVKQPGNTLRIMEKTINSYEATHAGGTQTTILSNVVTAEQTARKKGTQLGSILKPGMLLVSIPETIDPTALLKELALHTSVTCHSSPVPEIA